MNNKILALILSIVMVFTLAACGGKAETPAGAPSDLPTKETPAAANTGSTDTAQHGGSQGSQNQTPEPPAETIDDRLQLFALFLEDEADAMISEYEDCDPHYDLIYLDGDDLPELVIAPDWYHAARPHVYMVVDGAVKDVGEFGEYGTIYFKERESALEDSYYGMGASEVTIYSVDARGETEPLKSWYSCEDNDFENEIYDFVYMVDGEECDDEAYYACVEEWAWYCDSCFVYDAGTSYEDTKYSLLSSLQFIYENPADHSFDHIQAGPTFEEIEGEWILRRFETEGYEGLASDEEMNNHLIFNYDWTVDIYEQSWDDEPVDIDGVPVWTGEDGYLSFSFNDTRMDGENEITYTVLGFTEDGMLEISSMFEFGDGTYGGSELFYEKESGE